MRKLLITAILGAMVCTWGCRTSQENMYRAYEAAVSARNDIDEDSTIYTQIRRQMRESTMTVNGDTLPVKIQFVKVTDDGGGIPEMLKRYNVVVGQFKLGFNARSMRDRLVDNGYPGAFVVQDAEPFYFVVAASYADPKEAAAMLHTIRAEGRIALKAPCPFILEPSQLRR